MLSSRIAVQASNVWPPFRNLTRMNVLGVKSHAIPSSLFFVSIPECTEYGATDFLHDKEAVGVFIMECICLVVTKSTPRNYTNNEI